jgi:hypothetical protein
MAATAAFLMLFLLTSTTTTTFSASKELPTIACICAFNNDKSTDTNEFSGVNQQHQQMYQPLCELV